MPSQSGVPLTIHRDDAQRSAHVRASTVFGDDTICISSRTTRCQWIWLSGCASPLFAPRRLS